MVTAADRLRDAAGLAGCHARPPAAPDEIDGVMPAVVLEPAGVVDVAEALRWASSTRLSVVVRCAGSKDGWGRPPRDVDVLLRTTRLDRILAHEADDLTATVEAGARLHDVNRALATRGQFLPFDPPDAHLATIGGVLATNDAGPWRHRHGTSRDRLIGMTVVMPDGLVSSSGGRVVKNVAGYDLGRLMVGSHGSLAVIVSATFKLSPVPPDTRTLRIRANRPTDVSALLDQLRQRQCEPDAFEAHVAHGAADEVVVLVRYGSVTAAIDDACRETRACADLIGAATATASGDDADAWWRAHEAAGAHPDRVQLRLSWKPAAFAQATEFLTRVAGDIAFDWIGRVAVGSGVLSLGGDDVEAQARIIRALRTSDVFGHVVITRAAASLRRLVDVWAPTRGQLALWPALKAACDPHDTLGAGRGPL